MEKINYQIRDWAPKIWSHFLLSSMASVDGDDFLLQRRTAREIHCAYATDEDVNESVNEFDLSA